MNGKTKVQSVSTHLQKKTQFWAIHFKASGLSCNYSSYRGSGY